MNSLAPASRSGPAKCAGLDESDRDNEGNFPQSRPVLRGLFVAPLRPFPSSGKLSSLFLPPNPRPDSPSKHHTGLHLSVRKPPTGDANTRDRNTLTR